MRYLEEIKTLASIPLGAALGIALFIGGCGEEDQQSLQAVDWLRDYTTANPPNREWLAHQIDIDAEGRVVMDVLVPDAGQIALIKSRPRVEQVYISRMACPPGNIKFWKLLPDNGSLLIHLIEKTPAGQYEAIAGAECS